MLPPIYGGRAISEFDDDDDLEEPLRRDDEQALSPAGITESNGYHLKRYRDFRDAADTVAAAWRERPEVLAVSLIGSLARSPWKEVPRHSPYRRARIELWHECADIDLAVWLSRLDDLNGLRRAKNHALSDLYEEGRGGVAAHQTDVFVIEPGTDRYLGRLCDFNRCPKGKRECHAAGCGAPAHLQQHDDFKWRPDSLAEDRSVRLFDRATGRTRRAADLPLPVGADPGGPAMA